MPKNTKKCMQWLPAPTQHAQTLKPLPIRPFEICIRFPRQVSRDGYFSYDGVLYSVPWTYSGGEVDVDERPDGTLEIWWHGQRIAGHTLARDGARRITDPEHVVGLTEAQRQTRASGLRQCYPEVQTRSLEVYDRWAGGL